MYANPNAAKIKALQRQIEIDEHEATRLRKYARNDPFAAQTLNEIEARIKKNRQRANELIRALWGGYARPGQQETR